MTSMSRRQRERRETKVKSSFLIEAARQQSKCRVIPNLRRPLKGNYLRFIKQNRKFESRGKSAFVIRTETCIVEAIKTLD